MGYRARAWSAGYKDGGQSTFWGIEHRAWAWGMGGAAHCTPECPCTSLSSTKSGEELPQRARPGLSAPFPMPASGTLCFWHPQRDAADPLPHSRWGDPPYSTPTHTLPWSQRGLSGSESLLLLLLPPLSESGLLWDGEPTSEGGGVSISITSAFTTSMGASALPPPLQEATRSFSDSEGRRGG